MSLTPELLFAEDLETITTAQLAGRRCGNTRSQLILFSGPISRVIKLKPGVEMTAEFLAKLR